MLQEMIAPVAGNSTILGQLEGLQHFIKNDMPSEAEVSFSFSLAGVLTLHVDVRGRDSMVMAEARVRALRSFDLGGLKIGEPQQAAAPSKFMTRVSARITQA